MRALIMAGKHWVTGSIKVTQMCAHFILPLVPLFLVISQTKSKSLVWLPRQRVLLLKSLWAAIWQLQKHSMIKSARHFKNLQIFRIDHYLGKETVQTSMALRFANALYEPLWNSRHIDHVQITVSETVGLEDRAGYYDKAGAMRDMVQNHILQLLCLVAMEVPSSMEADAVRDEKLKVLRALKPLKDATVA